MKALSDSVFIKHLDLKSPSLPETSVPLVNARFKGWYFSEMQI